MEKSIELKEKIQQIYQFDLSSWSRLEDYLWNTFYVLSQREFLLWWWKISIEDILILENEYKKIVEIILNSPIQNLVDKLNSNKPSENWKNPNIESIKIAFWIN